MDILVLHRGLGEHGKRYDLFGAKKLEDVPSLDALVTYNTRGHGLTAKGSYCEVERVQQLASDFGIFSEYLMTVGVLRRVTLLLAMSLSTSCPFR
jgi:hypothetical protein